LGPNPADNRPRKKARAPAISLQISPATLLALEAATPLGLAAGDYNVGQMGLVETLTDKFVSAHLTNRGLKKLVPIGFRRVRGQKRISHQPALTLQERMQILVKRSLSLR
jgi:hypothetical protein